MILYSAHKSDKHEFATGFYISSHIMDNLLNCGTIIIIIYIKEWTSLIRSVSRVTTVLANVSSVFQLFSSLWSVVI